MPDLKTPRCHLVIGGDGLIGSGVVAWLESQGERVLATTRRRELVSDTRPFLDLATNVSDWNPPEPVATVFLCAGVTRMQDCEERPEETVLVNVVNPHRIAQRLWAEGAFVVGLSSNAVFDGSLPYRGTKDAHSPASRYGEQQSRAEKGIMGFPERSAVVRFTKVVSHRLPIFGSWLRDLAAGRPIRPLSDLRMAPLPHKFIVELIARVGLSRKPGLFQVSGAADVPYAEAGRLLVEALGLSQDLCLPGTSEELGITLLSPPRYTTLDMGATEAAFGVSAPNIRVTMAYLAAQSKSISSG